ncbi:hypothetical protein R1sor_002311 [Riccia sorocarpa]|uniref:4-coumarate--CoA ligase n=1 Tax=Riccia sorocarpa TaxID=122646 RepID=A0ABD3H4F8_9MARC
MGHEKSGYREYDGIYDSCSPWIPVPRNTDFTTYCLFQQQSWENAALVDSLTGGKLTFGELKTRVLSISSGLAQKGLKKGDVVMICMPNSIHWPLLFFGALHLGAILTTSNPLSTVNDISRQARDSKAAYLVTVPELWEKLKTLNLPLVLNDIDALGVRKPFGASLPLARLSELLEADPWSSPRVKIEESDTAVLLYSSGTTGPSKGVILTHLNCVAAVNQMDGLPRPLGDVPIVGIIIPLFHVMGLIGVCSNALRSGAQLVIFPNFDLELMLGAIQRYRITHMGLVPPILVLLAKSLLVEKYDLSSMQLIGYGAAPAGDVTGVSKRLKNVILRQGYGMTETGASAVIVREGDYDFANKYNSCGHLCCYLQAQIVDVSTGKPLPPNQEGELWLRGLNIMAGYLNNEKATAETIDKDGWLHTGDLAKIDENGFVYIVDRLKELIKYKGFQVAPSELESVLLNHPEITDTAVIPFPDEEAGEIPVAFVVKRAGSNLTEADVMQFVADRVSPYKKVRKVVFISSIPKLESGKLLRRDLKKLLTSPTSKL